MNDQRSDTKSSPKVDQKDEHKSDHKNDLKSEPKPEQKTDQKAEQKAEPKDEPKDERKTDEYKNLDFEQMKAKAPKLLADMVQMLITWQKMGFHVPRGVRNIFEFTWDELIEIPPKKSFTGLYCPVVKFLPCEEAELASATTSRSQKLGATPSGKRANYMISLENQPMLMKFQKRSIHLLTELLKLKMKIMIDAVAGSSTDETAKRFLESGQQLSPKSREEAVELMKEPRRKGRGAVPTGPAIPITSTTQLIQQMSLSCLCFSLSFKEVKPQKSSGLLKIKGGSSSIGQDKESILSDRFDPCPEARGRLREICRHIEHEKSVAIAKCHVRPLILKNYPTVHKSPSQALRRASLSQLAAEIRRSKLKKLFFSIPDGTSLIYYPSGNIAVFQFPICCIGKTITFLFQDVPSQGFLGMFTLGHSCLSYSFKSSFSVALLINQEGGIVRDKYGNLTHRWNWYSRKEVLQSLDFQINEQLKLKVLSQNSMTITFATLNESITLSLIRPGCLQGCKADKQLTLKNIEADEKEHWRRCLVDIKRRFEKTVKQFINSVLMISGICCIDYPPEFRTKPVKCRMAESPIQTWDRKLREEAMTSFSKTKEKRIVRPTSLPSYRPIKRKFRPASRAKEEIPDVSPALEPWAISPTDCPIVLRKVLTKTNDGLGCKCVVKIPLITDLEFEKFITAPRNPKQVIVICVLSPQKHSYSPFFEWSVEQLYIRMQHGRPSPCVQSKHDSYRFLKYDLENPLNKTPPLLVQKHGVVPGMVVMYAGGKLLFGSCVFNGYSYSKKDLLKQINQVCLDCKRDHFLPQSFKFSIYTTSIKECEEEQELVVEEKIEVEEKIKRAGRGKKKAKK
ncbi:uncharacterized protein C3orf20 homolog [Protobothrops mucrosquamatus]|uniref:uncharacterized protein C3orf20 homolog n=1 Tax=Protobothrops mucrosquamatus TaxID=103944 RepID=UPI0010FAD104|nr:uncharacterized protein C3orf20 homolog [Protobothrops mucrosquamatus]